MTADDNERTGCRSGQAGRLHLTVLRAWFVASIAVAVAAVLVSVAPARAAGGHRCPSHQYWDDIVVHGMSCRQAVQLHQEKLRACVRAGRHVTAHWYVYTCGFGPWQVTERVARRSALDVVYIRRDKGRVWLRYVALP